MENPFFIMYKDINYNANLFKKPKEVKGGNFECLFYDYLSKLSLIDYIHNANEQIKEIHIQFLTYKLLKAIQKMDSINISHSKINASNIMFDKEFNTKLIHFSEAKIAEEKSGLKEDLFQLGKTLAKIFSLGICTSINYNKKTNKYIIFGIAQGRKIQMETEKFFNYLKTIYKINLSENFLKFFLLLINAKKSKELVNISDLLKNEWICHIYQDIENSEMNFKKDFKELYENCIDDYEKSNNYDFDTKKYLNETKNEIQFDNNLIFPHIQKYEKKTTKRRKFIDILNTPSKESMNNNKEINTKEAKSIQNKINIFSKNEKNKEKMEEEILRIMKLEEEKREAEGIMTKEIFMKMAEDRLEKESLRRKKLEEERIKEEEILRREKLEE